MFITQPFMRTLSLSVVLSIRGEYYANKAWKLILKACSVVELYGHLDADTKDWVDGLFANLYRDINRPIEREVTNFFYNIFLFLFPQCVLAPTLAPKTYAAEVFLNSLKKTPQLHRKNQTLKFSYFSNVEVSN